jgi:hypothetical protein
MTEPGRQLIPAAGLFIVRRRSPCSPYVRHADALDGCMSSSDDNLELVDRAGQSILDLLHRAADAADQNTQQSVETAQRLAQQLQAARDRIGQLEGELADYRDRAERSESWLEKIHMEVEEQFPASGRKPQR